MDPSTPTLPATSVPVATTLYSPSMRAASTPSARLQVPSPSLTAETTCPATASEIVAAASSTLPLNGGVGSLVNKASTVTTGATVSIVTVNEPEGVLALPAASIALAVSV